MKTCGICGEPIDPIYKTCGCEHDVDAVATCDYCDGIVDPITKVCDDCGYGFAELYASGEYSGAEPA